MEKIWIFWYYSRVCRFEHPNDLAFEAAGVQPEANCDDLHNWRLFDRYGGIRGQT